MKNTATVILGIVAFISITINVIFSLQIFRPLSSSNKNLQTVRVVKVIDGDTFDTDNGERIRFYEINAPEYPKDCMGIDAKTRLEDLILNKNISIEQIKKDNFGRIVALVYLNQLLINEVLVEEGLAHFNKDKVSVSNSLNIEKAEGRAKAASRGIWSSLCQTKKDGCIIKGNYRSADNTRIYHTPDCYNYDRITIKPGTTDRWFCTEEEAKAAGFKKSLDCPK